MLPKVWSIPFYNESMANIKHCQHAAPLTTPSTGTKTQ